MKKYIIIIVTLILSATMNAQVDRSIQPKPGPAPKINLEEPQTFSCPNGLQVLLVENHKLPRVSASLRLDNEPFIEGAKAGAANIAGSLLGAGSKNMTKSDFDEEVDFLGARVGFDSEGAFASSLTKYFPRVFELMADAAIHPKFSQEEFDKIKNRSIDGIKSDAKSVAAIATRVRKAIGYGKSHPFGEFTTEETLKNITLEDAQSYYNTYYKPNNAYLVIVGDITLKEAKKLVKKHFKKWKKGDLPIATFPKPTNPSKTEIDFIDMPNAVQSEVKVVSTTNLKMADKDYHAVLLANQILGGDFNSYLNMNLREAHGYTYGARSGINASKHTSIFRAGASVRNAVTDSTVIETMKEITRIRTEKVDAETLQNVKAGYVGKFVLALEKPQTIANYALNIKTNELPADFYKTYLQKINAVTVDDIQRVAQKYFNVDNTRIIVVGKALDVLPSLEKLGYPINFFDTKADATKKPEMNKPVPNGVTINTVIDNFVNAIGGKEKLATVQSVFTTSEASMQGRVLNMAMKYKAPNSKTTNLTIGGMSLKKSVFNGTKGYSVAQGQTINLEGTDLEFAKKGTAPFEELALVTTGELVGIEQVNGNDHYVIKTGKDGKNKVFFDVKTGLKTKIISVQEGPGGNEMVQTLDFSDYKEVNGIKFSHTMKMTMGPMNFEFKTKEIKINEGVNGSDFE